MHRKPLTAPGALPPKPQIRKIAFEEHFLVPVAMKKDKDGKIDQQDVNYHAVENGLNPRLVQADLRPDDGLHRGPDREHGRGGD